MFSIREGRDEGQIGPIKKVLVSMRRDPVYRETKMRLIHKLDGIEFLKSSTDDSPPSERHSYKGYHVYGSRQEVTTRLQGSKPISCFRRGNSGADEVHVAFSEKEKRGETVSYLTLTYDTHLMQSRTRACTLAASSSKRKKTRSMSPTCPG